MLIIYAKQVIKSKEYTTIYENKVHPLLDHISATLLVHPAFTWS